MPTTITIPDFDFSGFYYGQILDALIDYKRRNLPEHTDESEYDALIQILRAFALVGHLNNVLIDLVANESTLPTAKLTETVRNMLRLIDYELATASPAQVDLVWELSKVFTTAATLINEGAQAATERTGTESPVWFEVLTALEIARSDQLSKVFALQGTTYTDYTDEANSQTTPADDWDPWSSGPSNGDAIYFGHSDLMWDQLGLWLTTVAAGISGVWEYYDGEYRKENPSSVSEVAGQLEFDLTSYLGSSNRAGTQIRIQLNETTAYEDTIVIWTGTINKAVTSFLGQVTPSTDPEDYSVGSAWEELDDLDDGTSDLTSNGDVTFTLPQGLLANWRKTTVNNVEAYWLRYRVIEASAVTLPTIQYARIDQGKQYALTPATQGRSIVETALASSDGAANQEFETTKDYYVNGTMEADVDGEAWSLVDNFLTSTPTSKHFRVVISGNDRATIVFGDGVNGRIPPVGVGNIDATYRYLPSGKTDGNVGSDTITVNKSGVTYVNKVWNPRPAAGWSEAEGADEESLERAKIAGPASLRTGTIAVGPGDVETLTKNYVDDDGARPFSRAKAIEEGFGPKTIELIVVASGGAQATNSQIENLEEYFNGNQYTHPPVEKHIVANQEVRVVNFTEKVIDIEATVHGLVTLETIENRLAAVFQPEALKADGVSYEWEFGEEVPTSRIIHEIFEVSENITRVDLTTPASNVALQTRELPVLGTLTITIVE